MTTASPLQVHCRLGHPPLPNLKKLVPSLSRISSLECESYQFGKHSRSSFPSRVSKRANFPFSVVHLNVWGPSRVSCKQGFHYFVTFIDDFSRTTWLYLMKACSKLFTVFTTFCAEIRTQFNVHVRVLRSDNALEYLSSAFKSYMASHGILHQTSCPGTPQQNGVAERKNRHLIETTCMLLLHMHVPVQYWDDVVLTACYLMNQMPSPVLNDQIPYSVLFPRVDLYSIPPRIFGSTYFVHHLALGRDKLSSCSFKCVFLGYSCLQKGYCCYSPKLDHYFVSADATFFESSPYFLLSSELFESVSTGLPLPVPFLDLSFAPPPSASRLDCLDL